MRAEVRKLFNVVFQEAHVIDFDLSQWDRRLRLVVSAGLVGENFEGCGELHVIDFMDLRSFSWKSNHLDVVLDDSDQHCQWVIMEFAVERRGEFEFIRLSGFGPTPELELESRDVAISTLAPSVVDSVNPGWNRPYCPLARPGFEELLEKLPT